MTGEVIGGSYYGTFPFKNIGSEMTNASIDTGAATAGADITSLVLVPASDGLNVHLYSYSRTA